MKCVNCQAEVSQPIKGFIVCSLDCLESQKKKASSIDIASGPLLKGEEVLGASQHRASRHQVKTQKGDSVSIEYYKSIGKKAASTLDTLHATRHEGFEQLIGVKNFGSSIGLVFPLTTNTEMDFNYPQRTINLCSRVLRAVDHLLNLGISYHGLTDYCIQVRSPHDSVLLHSYMYVKMGEEYPSTAGGYHFYSPEKLARGFASPLDDTYSACLSLACTLISGRKPIWMERDYSLEAMKSLNPHRLYGHMKEYLDAAPLQLLPILEVLSLGLKPEKDRLSSLELAHKIDSLKGQIWGDFSPRKRISEKIFYGKEMTSGADIVLCAIPFSQEKDVMAAVDCAKNLHFIAPIAKTVHSFELNGMPHTGIVFDVTYLSSNSLGDTPFPQGLVSQLKERGIATLDGCLYATRDPSGRCLLLGSFVAFNGKKNEGSIVKVIKL
jgi:hypothetical protein